MYGYFPALRQGYFDFYDSVVPFYFKHSAKFWSRNGAQLGASIRWVPKGKKYNGGFESRLKTKV